MLSSRYQIHRKHYHYFSKRKRYTHREKISSCFLTNLIPEQEEQPSIEDNLFKNVLIKRNVSLQNSRSRMQSIENLEKLSQKSRMYNKSSMSFNPNKSSMSFKPSLPQLSTDIQEMTSTQKQRLRKSGILSHRLEKYDLKNSPVDKYIAIQLIKPKKRKLKKVFEHRKIPDFYQHQHLPYRSKTSVILKNFLKDNSQGAVLEKMEKIHTQKILNNQIQSVNSTIGEINVKLSPTYQKKKKLKMQTFYDKAFSQVQHETIIEAEQVLNKIKQDIIRRSTKTMQKNKLFEENVRVRKKFKKMKIKKRYAKYFDNDDYDENEFNETQKQFKENKLIKLPQSHLFSNQLYFTGDKFQSRNRWKFPVAKNFPKPVVYQSYPERIQQKEGFFQEQISEDIYLKKSVRKWNPVKLNALYTKYKIPKKRVKIFQRFPMNVFDCKIEIDDMVPEQWDPKFKKIAALISEQKEILQKRGIKNTALDMMSLKQSSLNYKTLQFFQEMKKDYTIRHIDDTGNTEYVTKKYAQQCQVQQMMPKPLLNYFFGSSIFIEEYKLNEQDINALADTIYNSGMYNDTIIFKNNQLKDKQLAQLITSLQDCKCQRLSIEGNSFGYLTTHALSTILLSPKSPCLELNLNNCRVEQVFLQKIFKELDKSQIIKYLHVANVEMNEKTLKFFGDFLQHSFDIKYLNVSNNNLNYKLSWRFFKYFFKNESIKHLDFSGNCLHAMKQQAFTKDGQPQTIPILIEYVSAQLCNTHIIQHLHLDNCQLDEYEFLVLLQGIKYSASLISVHVSDNNFVETINKKHHRVHKFQSSLQEICYLLNGDKEFTGDVKINQFLLRKKVKEQRQAFLKGSKCNNQKQDHNLTHHRFHKISLYSFLLYFQQLDS